MPCCASPPRTFCQEKVTTSSLSKGKGCAKAALVVCAIAALWLGLTQSTVFEDRLSRAYREGLGEENVYSRIDAQWLALRTSISQFRRRISRTMLGVAALRS